MANDNNAVPMDNDTCLLYLVSVRRDIGELLESIGKGDQLLCDCEQRLIRLLATENTLMKVLRLSNVDFGIRAMMAALPETIPQSNPPKRVEQE